jgi:hypothetical protein
VAAPGYADARTRLFRNVLVSFQLKLESRGGVVVWILGSSPRMTISNNLKTPFEFSAGGMP